MIVNGLSEESYEGPVRSSSSLEANGGISFFLPKLICNCNTGQAKCNANSQTQEQAWRPKIMDAKAYQEIGYSCGNDCG
jgi:hypothetical protein